MKRRAAIVGPMATLLAASRARAEMFVDLALVLAVDVSRSIDEVELQRRGYIEALTSRAVIDAILSGENRRIAPCYVEWPDGLSGRRDRLDDDRQRSRSPALRRKARRIAAHLAELDGGRRAASSSTACR